MAHMFKGPGSLTSGSVITNASNITVTNATINNVVDNAVDIADDMIIGGDISADAVTATSITANIEEKVTTLSSVSVNTNYGTINVSNINILYLADNTYTGSSELIATITWSTIRDGHRLFIAWTRRGSATVPSVRLSFGFSKIYSTGSAGPNHRYVTFTGLGQNCTLYYSSVMTAWMVIESNGTNTSA